MDPGEERTTEPEVTPAAWLTPGKPPMRVEVANKWMLLLTDYLDVADLAAKAEMEAVVKRKWNSILDQADGSSQ